MLSVKDQLSINKITVGPFIIYRTRTLLVLAVLDCVVTATATKSKLIATNFSIDQIYLPMIDIF